ncbi:MAG: hypothetical protein HOZ81_20450 [Streptomyces sp.]|nr:hypothetical protein [Streptomyces sp.]
MDIANPGPRSLTDRIMGGPIIVHGREDLNRRLKAAKAAGVTLTVREAPKS